MAGSVAVQVVVRVRPLINTEQHEENDDNNMCVTFSNTDQLMLSKNKVFRFDRVYSPASTQLEVYTETIQPLVDSFLKGINCTVLVYGQTGSGKTYTLGSGGLTTCTPQEGIIPQTIKDIFDRVKKDKMGGVKYHVGVSYVEIYKDEIRDLLLTDSDCGCVIAIREDEHGKTVVTGLTEEVVSNTDEALILLESGNAVRVTLATDMNAHSSRSHVIFTLILVQEKPEVIGDVSNERDILTARLISKFHFVDLAGSERLNRTHNRGERFKESIHINSGLLALGNVINALADTKRRSGHVPYRQSKITRLIKDSLGGNAHTVMITCLSPCYKDLPESLNALKYAKRACNIKNHPVINQDLQHKSFLALREEIESLRAELQRTKKIITVSNTPLETVECVESSTATDLLTDVDTHISYLKKEIEISQHRQSAMSIAMSLASKKLQKILDSRDNPDMTSLKEIWSLLVEVDSEKNKSSDLESTYIKKLDEDKEQHDRLNKAVETIELLRQEIENCKMDLLSDEEIFAERETEYNSLQSQYKLLVERNIELECLVTTLTDKEHSLQQEMDLLSDEEIFAERETEYNSLQSQYKLLVEKNIELECLVTTLTDKEHSLQQEIRALQDQLKYKEDCDHLTPIDKTEITFQPHHTIPSSDYVDHLYNILHGKINVHSIQEPLEDSCDIALDHITTLLIEHNTISHESPVSSSYPPLEPINCLNNSLLLSQEKLKAVEKCYLEGQHKLRSLSLKIKFKEELIHELVKNTRTVKCLNQAYMKKIATLEKEAISLKEQLTKVTTARCTHDKKIQKTTSKISQTENQLQRKLKDTETKLSTLQRRRRDTLRLLQVGEKSEQRLAELEGEVQRLRNQQSLLQQKCKEEIDKKKKLETEVKQCHQQISTLTQETEQQGQVIRVKTQEVAFAQRKLRQVNRRPTNILNSDMSTDYSKWFQKELNKIAKERQSLEQLQKDLQEREALIAHHEHLLKEQSSLEIKKKHAHQVSSQNILHLSHQLKSLTDLIKTKTTLRDSLDDQSISSLQLELDSLTKKHKELSKKIKTMEDNLSTGDVLSKDEERRLQELNDKLEVLETSIQLKTNQLHNQNIPATRQDLVQLEACLSQLSSSEVLSLLMQSVIRIIELEEQIKEQEKASKIVEVQVTKQEEEIIILQRLLSQSQLDKQWKIYKTQKEHVQDVNTLLDHIAHTEDLSNSSKDIEILKAKIKCLEKDLYFYKKRSRDLKQELIDLNKRTIL